MRENRFKAAEAHAREALDLSQQAGMRVTTAGIYEIQARLAEAQGHHAAADRGFSKALRLLTELDATEQLAEAHTTFADVLKQRGDMAGAAKQWEAALGVLRPNLVRDRGLHPARADQSSGTAG